MFSTTCKSYLTFYSRISQFRMGRTSVRDNPRPARLFGAVTPTMVANVQAFIIISKDRKVTLQEIAYQLSNSKKGFYTKNRYEQSKCKMGAETADRRSIGSPGDHCKRTFRAF